jgi:hypothetical protein
MEKDMENISRINVMGVEFYVTYDVMIEPDPLGTGDSPAAFNVEISEITVENRGGNLLELLSDNVVNEVHEVIKKLY